MRSLCSTLLFLVLAATAGAQKKTPFVPHKVDGTHFTLGLPADYSLKKSDGIDFSVFYFSPADTTRINAFGGGFYFGNYPSNSDEQRCKTTTVPKPLFGKPVDWTVDDCDTSFHAEVIMDNPFSSGWDSKIHAFGWARSRAGLDSVFSIFATMEHHK